MKVILENFGPIKKVEFDLSKDLNVIFGKNNIGKSYAITGLYIILKHLLAEFGDDARHHVQKLYRGRNFLSIFSTNFSPFATTEADNPTSPLVEIVREVRSAFRKDSNLQEYDLSTHLKPLLQGIFSSALQSLFSDSFNNSFQSVEQLTNSLSNKPLRITIESAQFNLIFKSEDNTIILAEVELKHAIIAKLSKRNLQSVNNERGTTLYFKVASSKKGEQVPNNTDLVSIFQTLQILVSNFSRELHSITHSIYFLPASRSGLYQALSTFGALFAELSKSRNFVTKGISLPTISEPVADYFLRLSSMKPDVEEGEVSAIAQQIEMNLLGGRVEFDEQTKKLFFWQQSIDQQMDLSFASSMISEIAPIVAHFKYILRRETFYEESDGVVGEYKQVQRLPPSLLFIEEPEAHLHPEVQVKLMEFFARLTKHSVKVIMTSHSNYMFNKLSNLLLTSELEPDKVGSYLMRATSEGSVMDPAAMRAEEEGIADENFVDVAEQLYNERLEAYDKLNAKQ